MTLSGPVQHQKAARQRTLDMLTTVYLQGTGNAEFRLGRVESDRLLYECA